MATYVLNKYDAVKFRPSKTEYNVMIRITNPSDSFAPLEDEELYRDVLELKFYDFIEDLNGLFIFNKSLFETIMEFFEKHRNCKNMVIHCDMGMSRSAGVAVGWFLFNDDRKSVHKLYHDKKHIPNKLIVSFFVNKLSPSMNKIINGWEQKKLEEYKQLHQINLSNLK